MKNLLGIAPLALCVLATSALAQPKPSSNDVASKLKTLQSKYYAALDEYYKPYEDAKTDEERAKIKLDPKKDPSIRFEPMFLALAKGAPKNDTGFQAWSMVMQTAQSTKDRKTEELAINTLVKAYVNSPMITRVAGQLEYALNGAPAAQRKQKIAGWQAAIARSTNPDVRASLAYNTASHTASYGKGDLNKAKQQYQQVIAKFPNSQYAKRAERDIYEIENLSIGMEAPDFTASDENGTAFKLSDYRGKVVVLDFWGFW